MEEEWKALETQVRYVVRSERKQRVHQGAELTTTGLRGLCFLDSASTQQFTGRRRGGGSGATALKKVVKKEDARV